MNEIARDWNPVHQGNAYCSPACGFGCKRAAYERAVSESDELADRMGSGWKPRVWENCGWNYTVEKGVAYVHPNRDGSALTGTWDVTGYTVFFNTRKQVIAKAETPEDALGFATQDARTIVSQIEGDLATLIN